MRFLLSFFFLFSFTSSVLAHSWYPWECCSDNDCAPIKEIVVLENGDLKITITLKLKGEKGEVIGSYDTSAVFPKDFEQRTSKDGETHACIIAGKPKCLFIGAGL